MEIIDKLDSFEQSLLIGWEDVHKKSQLGLWIFIALKDGPKHMAQIKSFISEATNGSMSSDDQSMYRALRRFKDGRMVDFTLRVGKGGPDLKQYYLTTVGRNVVEAFLERQVKMFYNEPIKSIIKGEK